MKNLLLILSIVSIFVQLNHAQKVFTRTGEIEFESEAPLEKIEAKNRSAISVIDLESGNMEFSVLIKGFVFEKALMQEHFNENYMESSKFPKASFKGQIVNFENLDISKDGIYELTVTGDMTIHGVTNKIEAPAKIIRKGGEMKGEAIFEVAVADYEIQIPKVVQDKVAKIVKINVNCSYQEL